MESKKLLLGCISIVVLLNFAECDVEKDREKCANQLVGVATCLPYVSGEAKGPPIDCCTGFKQVLKNSIDCICLLIKDRNDPSLGLKINATLARSLPAKCQTLLNESITNCPRAGLVLSPLGQLLGFALGIGNGAPAERKIA